MKFDVDRCALAVFFLTLAVSPAFAGRVTAIFPVGRPGNVSVMQRDFEGNVYLAGDNRPGLGPAPTDWDAVVAKVSSSGKLLFWTSFGGSDVDHVNAIAVAADGSIAAVGFTASKDFPLTPDAAQTQFVPTVQNTTGFYVRLDPAGKVLYSSYLNTNYSPAANSPAPMFMPLGIALDSTGAVFITGSGSYTSTPGALPAVVNAGWILKLDGSGNVVLATGSVGGSLIAFDTQGFIYIAGSADASFPLPVTPKAFQSAVIDSGCSGGPVIGFPCEHQYVAKLDSSGDHLIYATWISGFYGASPSAVGVEDGGDVILAGGTQSTDYPVTAGAYQTVSYATPPPQDAAGGFPHGSSLEIPFTGYVTKLNATGSGLIFSTYLGGSGEDSVTSMVTDASGQIYLGGVTSSADFPGVPVAPDACHPSFVYPTVFATRLSADGNFLAETQLAFGLAPDITGPYSTVVGNLGSIGLDGQGKATALMGGRFASIDLFAAPSTLVCTTDAANLAPLNAVAPGQLLSLFGGRIGTDFTATAQPQGGSFPLSLGLVSVTFNGTPAPILYASSGQVNVQVPYESAGLASVTMNIQSPLSGASSVEFAVVASRPSVFLQAAEFASCGSITTSSVPPVALNADGGVNSCSNPAAPGSMVRVFLNGLGKAGGNPVTGAVSTVAKALSGAVTATLSGPGTSDGSEPVSLATSVGQINSVIVAAFAIPEGLGPELEVALTVNGVPVLDSVVIWVKSN